MGLSVSCCNLPQDGQAVSTPATESATPVTDAISLITSPNPIVEKSPPNSNIPSRNESPNNVPNVSGSPDFSVESNKAIIAKPFPKVVLGRSSACLGDKVDLAIGNLPLNTYFEVWIAPQTLGGNKTSGTYHPSYGGYYLGVGKSDVGGKSTFSFINEDHGAKVPYAYEIWLVYPAVNGFIMVAPSVAQYRCGV